MPLQVHSKPLPIIETIAQTTETRNFACANFRNLPKNNRLLLLPKLPKT